MGILADIRSSHELVDRKLIAYEKWLVAGSVFLGGCLLIRVCWLAGGVLWGLALLVPLALVFFMNLIFYLPHRKVAYTQLAVIRRAP